jgi:hypothetical protein
MPVFGQRVFPVGGTSSIGPAYFIVGVFYVALAFAPALPLAALCVLLAHFGGAILWVFSTVLLQLEVPDCFRGRVFCRRTGTGDADVFGVELSDGVCARRGRLEPETDVIRWACSSA